MSGMVICLAELPKIPKCRIRTSPPGCALGSSKGKALTILGGKTPFYLFESRQGTVEIRVVGIAGIK
jgi:hypothetical protein